MAGGACPSCEAHEGFAGFMHVHWLHHSINIQQSQKLVSKFVEVETRFSDANSTLLLNSNDVTSLGKHWSFCLLSSCFGTIDALPQW